MTISALPVCPYVPMRHYLSNARLPEKRKEKVWQTKAKKKAIACFSLVLFVVEAHKLYKVEHVIQYNRVCSLIEKTSTKRLPLTSGGKMSLYELSSRRNKLAIHTTRSPTRYFSFLSYYYKRPPKIPFKDEWRGESSSSSEYRNNNNNKTWLGKKQQEGAGLKTIWASFDSSTDQTTQQCSFYVLFIAPLPTHKHTRWSLHIWLSIRLRQLSLPFTFYSRHASGFQFFFFSFFSSLFSSFSFH